MNSENAEVIGLKALGWLSGHPELSGVFLSATGLGSADLSTRATDPEFLGFVLDFLLGNETALIDFAADSALDPENVPRARMALPGGEVPNWT